MIVKPAIVDPARHPIRRKWPVRRLRRGLRPKVKAPLRVKR